MRSFASRSRGSQVGEAACDQVEDFELAGATSTLRKLRFHHLRQTFGSVAINHASIVEVKTWMGHAAVQTTEKYLHYRPRGDEARRLATAFAVEQDDAKLHRSVTAEFASRIRVLV